MLVSVTVALYQSYRFLPEVELIGLGRVNLIRFVHSDIE